MVGNLFMRSLIYVCVCSMILQW
jgi:hypothetical protein